MIEYTWDNIIINPYDGKAKSAIGKECYFDNNPNDVLGRANYNDTVNVLPLKEIEPNSSHPFIFDGVEGPVAFNCIIVKKNSSYSERAKEWIKANDLKVGDCVKVLRKSEFHENGWENTWIDDMSDHIGMALKVTSIDSLSGLIRLKCYDADYEFPYFVLEKVVSPETKTVPFKDADEFLGYYGSSLMQPKETLDYLYRFLDGMWIRNKYTGALYQVISIGANGVHVGDFKYEVDWYNLHKVFEFLDSSPCGREVKDV